MRTRNYVYQIFILLLISAIIIGIVGCGAKKPEPNEAERSTGTDYEDYSIEAEGVEIIDFDNAAGAVLYTNHEFTTIEYGTDIVIIYFTFTNHANEYQCLYDVAYFRAYQNGIEIEGCYLDTDSGDNSWKEIAKDKTLDCAIAFKTTSKDAVQLRVSPLIDGSFNTTIYQEQELLIENHQTVESTEKGDSENPDISIETLQAIKDFDEFDLLTIQNGKISNDDYFVITEYELQNKNSETTISNLAFDFVIMDSDGEVIEIDNTVVHNESYLIRLEPRQKAELRIMTHVGDDEKHDNWGQYIVKYGYDMNGNRYTVDLVNKLGTAETIHDTSNVNFSEKNILSFSEAEYVSYRTVEGANVGNNTIKALSARIMIFDSEGKITDVKDLEYFGLGEEVIDPGEEYSLSVSDISAHEGGHIEVVSYTYDLGIADSEGFNHFEVNLITGDCVGSINAFALDQELDIDVAELDSFMATFGKKTIDIGFEVESIDNGESGGTDRISLKGINKILNLPGDFVLYRDYDSLLIYGFRFLPDNQDESTRLYLMNALKEVFGNEYEVKKYGYKAGEYVVWELDGIVVDLSWDYDLRFTVELADMD